MWQILKGKQTSDGHTFRIKRSYKAGHACFKTYSLRMTQHLYRHGQLLCIEEQIRRNWGISQLTSYCYRKLIKHGPFLRKGLRDVLPETTVVASRNWAAEPVWTLLWDKLGFPPSEYDMTWTQKHKAKKAELEADKALHWWKLERKCKALKKSAINTSLSR